MKLLKAIGSISVLAAAVVSASPALAGEILGRQYVILGRGSSPIPDNLIHIIPCTSKQEFNSVPLDCQIIEMESEFTLKLTDAKLALLKAEGDSLRSRYGVSITDGGVEFYEAWRKYMGIDKQIVPMLAKQPGYRTIRTDYEGKFSFNCPTKKCLVYSCGAAGKTFSYWMTIGTSGSRLDLAPSNGKTEDMPSDL